MAIAESAIYLSRFIEVISYVSLPRLNTLESIRDTAFRDVDTTGTTAYKVKIISHNISRRRLN